MKKIIFLLFMEVLWAKSIEKRSVTENGYYFYIPADRGCFDQLPFCPEMMCDHAQLRSLCLLSCGDCEPTKEKDNQENLQEIVTLFQSFFSSWPGSKLMPRGFFTLIDNDWFETNKLTHTKDFTTSRTKRLNDRFNHS